MWSRMPASSSSSPYEFYSHVFCRLHRSSGRSTRICLDTVKVGSPLLAGLPQRKEGRQNNVCRTFSLGSLRWSRLFVLLWTLTSPFWKFCKFLIDIGSEARSRLLACGYKTFLFIRKNRLNCLQCYCLRLLFAPKVLL
jgi:hypothetical protein